MTFGIELFLWFLFVLPGLVCALLSLSRAVLVLRAVRLRHALPEVQQDARHVVTTALLLAGGWLVFVIIGLIGAIGEHERVSATPAGTLIQWGLLCAVAIWALKTINDYVYTRRVWKRPITRSTQQEGPTS